MDTLIYSFTGTQLGMNDLQKAALWAVLSVRTPGIFVHGDCVGADAEAHVIAKELGWRVRIYPSTIINKRAHCDADEVRPEARPEYRNIDIVEDGDLLIAAPNEVLEVQRSGTWMTVRRAQKSVKPIIMLWPGLEGYR